jgi:hypothetical protein
MDPTLNGTIRHILDSEGTKVIGLTGKADIGLNGLGLVKFCRFIFFDIIYSFYLFLEYLTIMPQSAIRVVNLHLLPLVQANC